MPRFSISAEFLLDCADADTAATIVGNFVDSFPAEVSSECEEPDVILQGPAEEQ